MITEEQKSKLKPGDIIYDYCRFDGDAKGVRELRVEKVCDKIIKTSSQCYWKGESVEGKRGQHQTYPAEAFMTRIELFDHLIHKQQDAINRGKLKLTEMVGKLHDLKEIRDKLAAKEKFNNA